MNSLISPLHVENLASVESMAADGWRGSDASLDESLFEYGLAWREIVNETGEAEFAFVYKIGKSRFDRCSFKKNLDPEKEWNWVEWDSLANCCGSSKEDLLAPEFGLANLVSTLVSYYGFEEIFGTSYWEGFKVKR